MEKSFTKEILITIGLLAVILFFLRSGNTQDEVQNEEPSPYIIRKEKSVEQSSSGYYKGFECASNCSGHIAGYDWAEEKGIDDPRDCGGNSESFIEGCISYVLDNN